MSDFTTDTPGQNGPAPFGPRPEPAPGTPATTTPRFAPQPRTEQPRPDQPRPEQPRSEQPRPEQGPAGSPEVKGRITIADEVVEKVAGLAAMEVEGVADLGGDFERAVESVRERIGLGNKRGDQGVKADVKGQEVAISVTVMVEFGYVVLDVARQVQLNVARKTQRMLGLRVVEVNVTVDDVRTARADEPDERGGRGRLTSGRPGQPRPRRSISPPITPDPWGGAVVDGVDGGPAVVAVVAGAVVRGTVADVVVGAVVGGAVPGESPAAAGDGAPGSAMAFSPVPSAPAGPSSVLPAPGPRVVRPSDSESLPTPVPPPVPDAASPSAARSGGAPRPRSPRPEPSSSIARPSAPNAITTAARPVTISTLGCTRSRAVPTDSFSCAQRSRTVIAPRIPCQSASAWGSRRSARRRTHAFAILPHRAGSRVTGRGSTPCGRRVAARLYELIEADRHVSNDFSPMFARSREMAPHRSVASGRLAYPSIWSSRRRPTGDATRLDGGDRSHRCVPVPRAVKNGHSTDPVRRKDGWRAGDRRPGRSSTPAEGTTENDSTRRRSRRRP